MLEHFYGLVHAVMLDSIPTVITNSNKFPYWYDSELIALVKEKEKHHKLYIKHGRDKTSDAYSKFSDLRKEIKYKQKYRHIEYVGEIGLEMKQNPKRLWTYANSFKLIKTIPSLMTFNGINLYTISYIVDKFNLFFKSVFKCDTNEVPECPTLDGPLFKVNPITLVEMKEQLQSLNPHSSSGNCCIPTLFSIPD